MRTLAISAGLAAAAAAAAVAAIAAPGTALAATSTPDTQPRTLAGVQAAADAAIDLRLGVLARNGADIARARHLSAADRSVLAGVVTHDLTGLAALRVRIGADTTRAQAAADAGTVYSSYRVFALFQPQLHDVIAADTLVADAQQVSAAATTLHDRLAAAGRLTATETTALAAAGADAVAVTTAVNGEVAAVVALVPSDVSKGVRPAELATAKADNVAARTQLAAARAALASARTMARAHTAAV